MPATNTNNQIEESPTKNDEQAAEAPPVVDPVCPICHNIISGSLEDVNDHIDECLGDASSEVEPGQRRTVFETPGSDFDELPTAAINIEGDESRYGKPQYANADVTRILQEVKKNPFKDILDTIPDSTMEDPKEVMLKRLRLQKERLDSAARCILCLDSFINPVVSTVCWHVYCEACWCLTLDCKRLCPQCNKITSAEDLRRIYF